MNTVERPAPDSVVASLSADPRSRVIRSRRGLVMINFSELWRYRELFGFLMWRDILVRYKQTYLGISWAVIQPVLTMVVFTVVYGRLGKFPSHGAPYGLITLSALLPWQFFANALTDSSSSLVAASNMISKIYFPRLIVPCSAVFSGVIDFGIGFLVLLAILAWKRYPIETRFFCLPLFLMLAVLAALAAGVWLSALNVQYRDVKYIVPFFTRIGMIISPVGFISDIVPERWRLLYNLNPLVGVIDGFRWSILGDRFSPYWPGLWLSMGLSFAALVTGLVYFRTMEKQFADVI